MDRAMKYCVSRQSIKRPYYKYVHNCQPFLGLRTNSGNDLTFISTFNNVGILNHARKYVSTSDFHHLRYVKSLGKQITKTI